MPFSSIVAALSKKVEIKQSETNDVVLKGDADTVSGNDAVTLALVGKQGWFNVLERLGDAKNLMPVCTELDEHLKLRSYLDDAIEPQLADSVIWASLRGKLSILIADG
jgi:hypothetical protein